MVVECIVVEIDFGIIAALILMLMIQKTRRVYKLNDRINLVARVFWRPQNKQWDFMSWLCCMPVEFCECVSLQSHLFHRLDDENEGKRIRIE